MTTAPLVVGKTRIRDKAGYTGTVLYVGPVATARSPTELYAGIQWDDPTRGKHNGSVIKDQQLYSYFHCDHPTGASFIKVSQLDTGVCLNESLLYQKYVRKDSPECVAPDNQLPHSIGNKIVELHGEHWIRSYQQVDQLTCMSLRRHGISSIDTRHQNRHNHVLELDLAGNLLSDWTAAVHDLLRVFPNLQYLSLAGNRLQDWHTNTNDIQPYPAMQRLNLNRVALRSTASLPSLSQAFPNLQELCIAHNNCFQDWNVVSLKDCFTHLTKLDCSSCHLTTEQLELFQDWKSVTSLCWDDNPIKDLCGGLEHIQHIQLSHTKIHSYPTLERYLKHVTSLRLCHCPLDWERYMLIARLPNLQHLNGSDITGKERIQAERRYVAHVSRLSVQQQQEHSNYARLKAKHADAVVNTTTTTTTNNDSQHLLSVLNVTVTSMAASSCTMQPWIRRVPSTLTIGRLKMLLFGYFGIHVDMQVLHWKSEDFFPIQLDKDEKSLAYYGIPDGAEILLNEIVEAKQNDDALVEFQNRIEQQQEEWNDFQERKKRQDCNL